MEIAQFVQKPKREGELGTPRRKPAAGLARHGENCRRAKSSSEDAPPTCRFLESRVIGKSKRAVKA